MARTFPAFVRNNDTAQIDLDNRKPPGIARAICVPGQIRLPRSAVQPRSSDFTFLKLLDRVTEHPGGSAFEGRILRPGDSFPENELPDPAVLLECAGTEGRGRGHNRGECRYIVWKWDKGLREWNDLAQASSVNGEWALGLLGVARRALEPEERIDKVYDCQGSVDRILSFAQSELHGMSPRLRIQVLERLYGRIAGLVAA